jgi:predicted nucleic acid-binding protein
MEETIMALVKKTIELDQDAINRIKMALNAKTEKEAINTVLKQVDTDILLSEITFKDAGTFNFEAVFEE